MDVEGAVQLSKVRALVRSGAARRLRIGAGLSIGEAASAADISASALSRWESGHRVPTRDGALRYLRLLEALMQGGR